MAAHEHGVAVLVCCETYKFTERVLLDAICYNELGDPDALLQAADADQGGASLSDWRERPRLKLLNHHKPLIHTLHFEKRNIRLLSKIRR